MDGITNARIAMVCVLKNKPKIKGKDLIGMFARSVGSPFPVILLEEFYLLSGQTAFAQIGQFLLSVIEVAEENVQDSVQPLGYILANARTTVRTYSMGAFGVMFERVNSTL